MTKIEKLILKRLKELEAIKTEYMGNRSTHNYSAKERRYVKNIEQVWMINYNILRHISPNLQINQ